MCAPGFIGDNCEYGEAPLIRDTCKANNGCPYQGDAIAVMRFMLIIVVSTPTFFSRPPQPVHRDGSEINASSAAAKTCVAASWERERNWRKAVEDSPSASLIRMGVPVPQVSHIISMVRPAPQVCVCVCVCAC